MNIPSTKGVLLDLDGTVYEGDGLVTGATDAIHDLRGRGIAVRFGTNTTRMSRAEIIKMLSRMGLAIKPGELFTAPLAAVRWLHDHGISRVALYLPDATLSEFSHFTSTASDPEAVLVGDLGEKWSFEIINRAFRQILDGARLVALQRNKYWKTDDGLTIDAGPFIAALEFATGTQATVVGKPNRAFFEAAAQSMDIPVPAMVVIGDDVTTDIAGAQQCGAHGVLVRTGKFRPSDLTSDLKPDAVIDSVADVPSLFGE